VFHAQFQGVDPNSDPMSNFGIELWETGELSELLKQEDIKDMF
jgi:hypothetical protein